MKNDIKFDEAFKKLFLSLTDDSIIRFLNYVFNENIEEQKIEPNTNLELIDRETLEKLYSDLYFKITDKDKTNYHIEMEGKNNGNITIRMFKYAFRIAESEKEENEEEIILTFPK